MAKICSIPIGHSHYKVVEVKVVRGDTPGEILNGETDFEKKVIRVSSMLPHGAKVIALWHEFGHAFLHETGSEALCRDEGFVESLAQAIARALQALPVEYK